MTTQTIKNGNPGKGRIILAHGAGAPMDTPFMTHFAESYAALGFEVIRFEFPYMAMRRVDGKKRGPGNAMKLIGFMEDVIAEHAFDGPLIIGGKSMGGRIASLIAASGNANVSGLVCLGYPFHPPGKPENLRTVHLSDIKVPTLIAQGERDPFGGTELTETLSLPENITIHIAPDGNHDLVPRKKSGHTAEGNWAAATEAFSKTFA